MSNPVVAAYKRNDSIALVFADGTANEFDTSRGGDAEMSLVCFDGRQQGWTEISVQDGVSEANACGFDLQCVEVTELPEPSFEEVEAWLEDNTWV